MWHICMLTGFAVNPNPLLRSFNPIVSLWHGVPTSISCEANTGGRVTSAYGHDVSYVSPCVSQRRAKRSPLPYDDGATEILVKLE